MKGAFSPSQRSTRSASSRKHHAANSSRTKGGPEYVRSFLPYILQHHLDSLGTTASHTKDRRLSACGIASLGLEQESIQAAGLASPSKRHRRPAATTHFWSIEAVWCFLDISGFSGFAHHIIELFRDDIPAATECIITHLNNYFAQVMTIIAVFKGDVVCFSGDALLVSWYYNSRNPQSLQSAVASAVCCLTSIVSRCSDFEVKVGDVRGASFARFPAGGSSASRQTGADGLMRAASLQSLSFRFSIHAGASIGTATGVVTCSVGGSQRKFVAVGAPIHDACLAALKANSGELVVTQELQQATEPLAVSTPIRFRESGNSDISESGGPPSPPSCKSTDPMFAVELAGAWEQRDRAQIISEYAGCPRKASSENVFFWGPSFMPDCAFVNLASQLGRAGEFRIVSTLFLGFVDSTGILSSVVVPASDGTSTAVQLLTDPSSRDAEPARCRLKKRMSFLGLPQTTNDQRPEDMARELHTLSQIVHRYVAKYRGTCNKVVLDDKGLVALCVFGLPQHTHENDADRAVLCALEVASKLSKLGKRVASGVSRAKVYCGTTGSNTRREYTVLGDGVNVAARMMSCGLSMIESTGATAPGRGEIFCCVDEGTMLASTALNLNYSHAQDISVKHCENQIRVFRAVRIAGDTLVSKYSTLVGNLSVRSMPRLRRKRRISGIEETNSQDAGDDVVEDPEVALDDINAGLLFAGREKELDTVATFVDAVLGGEAWKSATAPSAAPTLMILGPPQSGKTHLVNKALSLTPHALEACVRVTAHEFHFGTPFNVVGQAVSSFIHLEGLEWINGLLASTSETLRWLLQLVVPLRFLPRPSGPSSTEGPASSHPWGPITHESLLQLTFLVASVVESSTKVKLLIVEDAQWVDSWSWSVLLTLSTRRFPLIICARAASPECRCLSSSVVQPGSESAMITCTSFIGSLAGDAISSNGSFREDAEHLALQRIRDQPAVSTRKNFEQAIFEASLMCPTDSTFPFPQMVQIPPMDEQTIAQLGAALFAADQAATTHPFIVKQLLERTGGTAGIIHEALVRLKRQGHIACRQQEVKIVHPVDWSLVCIENSILETNVMRAVDMLPYTHRIILSICSVFRSEHIRKQHLFAATKHCLEVPNEFRFIVRDLVQGELLLEVSGTTLRFLTHMCMKDILYHRMLASERNRFHGIIAAVLSDDVSPPHEEVSYHFKKAGKPTESHEWLLKGAVAAAKRRCPIEAMRLLDQLPPQSQLRLATSRFFLLERHFLYAECCTVLRRLEDARSYLTQAQTEMKLLARSGPKGEAHPSDSSPSFFGAIFSCCTAENADNEQSPEMESAGSRMKEIERNLMEAEQKKASMELYKESTPGDHKSTTEWQDDAVSAFGHDSLAESLPRWSEASSSISEIDCVEHAASTFPFTGRTETKGVVLG